MCSAPIFEHCSSSALTSNFVMLRRLLSTLLVSVLVVGCMNVSTTLTVRPDGSGTVRERLTVSPQFASMMKSMKQMSDSTSTPEGLFTEAEIRKDASSLGMRLESVQMISGAEGEGYEAVYGFDNVNDVRFAPSPDDVLPKEASQQTEENPFELLSAVDVSHTAGSPATLTIRMPRDETPNDQNASEDASSMEMGEDEPSPQELQMMREMMQNGGIHLAVTIDGEIVETNAVHRSGSTITLVDMDFGQLAQDSTAFKRMMAVDQPSLSPEAAIDSLNALPGITIEPQEAVTVRFQ